MTRRGRSRSAYGPLYDVARRPHLALERGRQRAWLSLQHPHERRQEKVPAEVVEDHHAIALAQHVELLPPGRQRLAVETVVVDGLVEVGMPECHERVDAHPV